MENIKTLLENNEHEKILLLPSPDYDSFKVIAFIHLGKYKDALFLINTPCYEKAYCFYKLKNFHRSLKVLNKLKGEKVDILKAQNLYFLGYHSDAYKILSEYGNSDEIAVNLSAMEALDHINQINKQKPSLFTSKDVNSIENKRIYHFKDAECALESSYNLAFKNIENERLFIQKLTELDKKYNVVDSCIQKQLKNLLEEEITKVSGRDLEILNFNRGIVTEISNPVLFQPNFIDSINTDFKIFKDYQSSQSDYLLGKKNVNLFNNKLKLLKAMILVKRRKTDKRNEEIKKILENTGKCIEKDILELLVSNDSELHSKGIDLLMKSSNE